MFETLGNSIVASTIGALQVGESYSFIFNGIAMIATKLEDNKLSVKLLGDTENNMPYQFNIDTDGVALEYDSISYDIDNDFGEFVEAHEMTLFDSEIVANFPAIPSVETQY